MSIKEQLKRLIELQQIDTQIYHLRWMEREEIPQRLKKCDEELLEVKSKLSQFEEKLKTLQLEKRNKELDLQTRENNVKKFQLQLFQVKTNREYGALEKEIEGLKADNSLLEEEIIHLLDEIDLVAASVGAERKRFDEESKKGQQEKEQIRQELEQVQQKLSEFESSRKILIPHIDSLVLPRYERVLKLRQGVAVVPVRNDSCQGCFMNLPPQVIHLVHATEDWVMCEQCARILYLENEDNG